jgi:hypothetical protein
MLLAGLSGSAPTAVTDGGDPRRARERFIARGGEALGGAQQAGLYPADRGRITRHQRGQIGKRHTRSFTSAAYLCPEEAALEGI